MSALLKPPKLPPAGVWGDHQFVMAGGGQFEHWYGKIRADWTAIRVEFSNDHTQFHRKSPEGERTHRVSIDIDGTGAAISRRVIT